MPNPRASGGSTSIRRWSIQMLPPVSGSRPARQFSAVDLPQPEGPSRATNSPPLIASSRSSSATLPAKLRLTRSSRSSAKRSVPLTCPPRCARRPRERGLLCSLGLPAPDLAIPLVERGHLLLGRQRRLLGDLGDPLVELGHAELLDCLLAVGRRHVQGHALDRRTRVEVAAVVGLRLLLRLQHEPDELQVRG